MRIPVQELVEMYKDNIYAAAFNICKSAADAEDVVQDTFLQYYIRIYIYFCFIILLYDFNKEIKLLNFN